MPVRKIVNTGAQTPIPVDPKILHFIVCTPGTLDAVYEEHMWETALLGKTLRALGIPESEVADLSELDWSYAADRIARERVRRGRPVHRQNVILEIITAYIDVSYDIPQIERNLVQVLEKMGVKPAVVMSLRDGRDFIYMLADRLALELEQLGHRAEYQTARQMRQGGLAVLAPSLPT